MFLWQAIRNKIASKANLRVRGIELNGDDKFPLCNEVSESTSHLLLHCKFIWPLWGAVIDREGL